MSEGRIRTLPDAGVNRFRRRTDMIRKYKNLCKPITIGNVTFRNRMFSAPMSGAEITPECTIGSKSTSFYELRAKGGAGAVTVSELMVHPPTDASHAYHLNTQTVGSVASFTYTADAIKRHGAVPSVELSHSGQYAGQKQKRVYDSVWTKRRYQTRRPSGDPSFEGTDTGHCTGIL